MPDTMDKMYFHQVFFVEFEVPCLEKIQYDDENLNVYLIELYEQLNINSYEFDKMRTNYAFAKCMNMDQAVNLYDSLTENGKSDLVEVIKFDFPHLHDLARIHDTFEFESVDVITSTVQ